MNGFKEFVPINIHVNSNGAGRATSSKSPDKTKNTISGNLLTIKPANEWIDIAKNQPMPNMLFGPLWHEGNSAFSPPIPMLANQFSEFKLPTVLPRVWVTITYPFGQNHSR